MDTDRAVDDWLRDRVTQILNEPEKSLGAVRVRSLMTPAFTAQKSPKLPPGLSVTPSGRPVKMKSWPLAAAPPSTGSIFKGMGWSACPVTS